MQYLKLQKHLYTPPNNKWLRRACTMGFVFFLIKGLAWIAVAVWVIN